MKNKKCKPRRMWANYYAYGPMTHHSKQTAVDCAANGARGVAIPVAVIPLDDVDALVDNALTIFYTGGFNTSEDAFRAALTAIGVLPKSRKKGGRK